jgi:hypothetical protein
MQIQESNFSSLRTKKKSDYAGKKIFSHDGRSVKACRSQKPEEKLVVSRAARGKIFFGESKFSNSASRKSFLSS